jgi:hypothetical protein
MMTADDLAWPGSDQRRAIAAAWHLARVAQLLGAARDYPRCRHLALAVGREHLRNARGYLGAIGFEHRSGLWRSTLS